MDFNWSLWLNLILLFIIWTLSNILISWNRRRQHSQVLDTVAGTGSVKRHLLFGHIRTFGLNTTKGLMNLTKRPKCWPKMFNVWVGPVYSMLHLYHPDSAGPVLKSPPSMATKDHFIYQISRAWIGHGLVTSDGELWARHRKMLTPAFHFTLLRKYGILFLTLGISNAVKRA